MTVVETPGFLRDASSSLTELERFEMITFLASNPEMGEVMPGTGGARKLRWRARRTGQARRRSGDLLLS